MSEKIKAGCIVKTKFVKASSDIFSGYIDYIDRENAVRNDAIPLYSLYSDYMDNPEKTTDLFTNNSDHLNSEEKASLKRTYEKAQKNGSPMWQTVISFDNRWLEENGLYDSSTKILDVKKLMNYTRDSIHPMLKNEGLENAVWSAAIHYNTDNLHIHIASVEPIPTREKMIVNGQEEYRGKFKLSSIEKCKSKMVNQIIEQSLENQKISTVMRDSIISAMKGNILFEDREIIQQFLHVYNHMPEDKSAWKYGMNKIANLRPEIDKITKMWITKYKAEEYTEFRNLLDKQYPIYKESYGENSKDVYIENRIKDLFKRCGNVILSQMKNMTFSDINELEQNSYIAAEVNEAIITGEKLDFDGKINYKSSSYENKSKYWTDTFKEAKNDLSYALLLEDPEEKAEYLNQILNVLKEEISNGNDVVAYELGRYYKLGTFSEINPELSQKYYEIAFNGFKNELNSDNWLNIMIAKDEFIRYNYNLPQAEFEKNILQFAKDIEREEWMQNYLNYRVGRMLVDGEGVEKNVKEGMAYLEQSSSPFAHFTLGNMYYYGREIEQDYQKAYDYFSLAGFPEDGKSMPFAIYNMAEMLEKGLVKDNELDKNILYKTALSSFISSEEEAPNDLIEYKIATMLLSGKGCDIDTEAAEEYLIKSSEYGNVFASTKLANLYIQSGDPDKAEKAVFLLQAAAYSDNNDLAQYQLGKIRTDEASKYFNPKVGIDLLEKSADQNNDFAQYTLGNIFYKGSIVEKDVETALKYLNSSSEHGNQYAQYALGMIYLKDENSFKGNNIEKAKDYFSLSADQGNMFAQYQLGKIHLENDDFKDIEKATEYFSMAEENENPYIQYNIGRLYLENPDVQNINKAVSLFTKSAEQDNPYAAYTLGNIYSEEDKETADTWYLKAHEGFVKVIEENKDNPNDSILYNLGNMNLKGLGVEKNLDAAIDYFTKSADSGNEFAQYQLGSLYYKGEDIVQNANLAMQYLTLSADQGNQFAQYTLGTIYQKGDIAETDIDKAIFFFELSADQDNQFAQYQLGRIYYSEEYGQKDIYKALINFNNSAEQGNEFAQYQLGLIYYKGDDIEQNAELAMQYLTLSAEQDNQFAQYQLGMIYLKGDIADKDINKVISFFEASADQDNQFAQYQLGKLYYFGTESIAIDKEKANYYLTQSASQGNELAQALLDWKPSLTFGALNHQMGFSETMATLSSDMRSLFERLSNEHDHMLNQMVYQRIEREKQQEENKLNR